MRSLARHYGIVLAFAAAWLLAGHAAHAQDISNPLRLAFAADAERPIIDVIDVEREEVVYRIETEYVVDDIAVTPQAPVLVYTNIERRLVTLYDLRSKEVGRRVELQIAPRHMVLNTRGDKAGITDSLDGGFVLLSTYSGDVLMTLEDLPPTTDVLFDPNDIEIYYSNGRDGTIGMIDTNLEQTVEIELTEPGQQFSSPSRSLDARYVYVANDATGEVYSLNAFSKVIYQTFAIGEEPARPYTTPEGSFLYMMDKASGRFLSIEQFRFEQYNDTVIGEGIDLVTVGRFDRLNLIASTENSSYYIYDNTLRSVIKTGEFRHTPLDAQGSADGRRAFVAFRDGPEVALIDLESQELRYLAAAETGVGAFTIGLTNNVCH